MAGRTDRYLTDKSSRSHGLLDVPDSRIPREILNLLNGSHEDDKPVHSVSDPHSGEVGVEAGNRPGITEEDGREGGG